MTSAKIKLIMIAILGALLGSSPSTLSLFSDTHSFINFSVESDVCTKCHGDIQIQIEDPNRITTIHRTLDSDYGCKMCHANPNNTLGRNVTQDYHVAYSPYCVECHNNTLSINGPQEAHVIIVTGVSTSTLSGGINEACAICHTTMFSSVTVRNREVFAFENDSEIVNGTTIYNGSYTTTFDNLLPTGIHNYNGGAQCIMCHMPVYEILNNDQGPYPEHAEFGCEGCHRGSGMDPLSTNEPQIEYHTAKIKYCSDCHGEVDYPRDCNQCHTSHGGFKPGSGG